VRVPTRTLVFGPGPSLGKESVADKNSKGLIMDLLSVNVRPHSFRFKYFALRNNLCMKVRAV
jgi:hypothetical protein